MTSLCQLAQDWRGTLPAEGAGWEEKINGWRCMFFRDVRGQPRLWTREGMPLEGADHVLHRLCLFEEAAGMPLFIDNEIQVDGSLEATKAWFETGWRFGGEKGLCHAFDVLSLAEWRQGGSAMPQIERKAWLRELAGRVGEPWDWRAGSHGRDDPGCVRVLEDGWVVDEAHALAEARRIWAAGGEGLMLKDPLAPYRRNRNGGWSRITQANAQYWRKAA